MNKLRLTLVLDDPADPSFAERSALNALLGNPRFSVGGIIHGGKARAAQALAYRVVNAIDASLFARPRTFDTPNFDAAGSTLAVQSPEAFLAGPAETDVIIDFTECGAPATLRERAQFGVWRLTCCDRCAAFSDVLSSPTANVALVRFEDSRSTPRQVSSAAYNIKFSAARTAAFIREKSVQLLTRELTRLAIDGAPQDAGPYETLPPAPPTLAALAAYSTSVAQAVLQRGVEKARILAGLRPGMFFLRYGQGGPLDFDVTRGTEILPPGNQYWADPFLFEADSDQFIFFEDYSYDTGRGQIGVGKIDATGFSYIGPALETDYHLSYPFVFRHNGEIFMLPETNETRRLEIWRCDRFPDRWSLCATALEGETTADSVIFQRDGAWWLFANMGRDSYGDHSSELHLFRADGPMLQKLQPHPLNPVVIDSRTARGGGGVYDQDGRLFRISQDNSHGTYGYALNVMEITRLDNDGYAERLLRKITPDFEDGLIGCHHGDFAAGAYVIDARRRVGGKPQRKR